MQGRTLLLHRQEVEERCQLSRSTLYRMMREGALPEPIEVGAGAVRWPELEIAAWLSERPRATGDLTENRRAIDTNRRLSTRPAALDGRALGRK